MLERVIDPCAAASGKRKPDDWDIEENSSKRRRECDDDRAKMRPVALVSPRMQNTTASTVMQPSGKRGRPKRRSKDSQSTSDSSVKIDHGQRPFYDMHTVPSDLSRPFQVDVPQYLSQHTVQDAYSALHQSPPCVSDISGKLGNLASTPIQRGRRPDVEAIHPDMPYSDPRDYYLNRFYPDSYPRGHNFYDATRSLLQMNGEGGSHLQKPRLPGATSLTENNPRSSDMLNSSFPPHVSATTPFWQQYSNLARTILAHDGNNRRNIPESVNKRLSEGSTTDTASISSQEGMTSPNIKCQSPARPSQSHKNDSRSPVNKVFSPVVQLSRANLNAAQEKRKMTVTEKAPAHTGDQEAQAKSPKFSTKHFITQSAIASFPHLSKSGGAQKYSVSSLLTSQQSILERAALKSNGLAGRITQGQVSQYQPAISAISNQGLRQKSMPHEGASKTTTTQGNTSKTTTNVLVGSKPVATNNNEALKQFGLQLSLQKGTSQAKILLSDLSLPARSAVFSSPLMTYQQLKQENNSAGSATSEVKKQSNYSHGTGTSKSKSAGVAYKHRPCLENWSAESIGSSSTCVPPELNVGSYDSNQGHSSMSIYKPGTVSGGKSTRKDKQASKTSKSAKSDVKSSGSEKKVDDVTDLHAKTVPMTSSTYRPIVPNPCGRVVYQNPIMTILPTHSRLLVVPNVPSVTTSSPSLSTVLYINSQNSTQKARYPIISSNPNATSHAETNTVESNASSVVTGSVETSSVVTSPVVTCVHASSSDRTATSICSKVAEPIANCHAQAVESTSVSSSSALSKEENGKNIASIAKKGTT